ncbi:MAG: hypothetical protein M8357_07595 [Desulfobulbaceae bacterium]|nr:hypothetical protein [Desulfobulbaceae bacterium]
MKKVQVSTGKPLGRIVCPQCGNDREFIELARDVIVTTRYVQNDDGSFTPQESDSEVLGKVGLYCSQCDTDISFFHNHLMEMIF